MRRIGLQNVDVLCGERAPQQELGRMLYMVATLETLHRVWLEDVPILLCVTTQLELHKVNQLRQSGLRNVTPVWAGSINTQDSCTGDGAHLKLSSGTIENQDVIAIDSIGGSAEVLFRASDLHHTVFLTNRCNSRCVMCSQPPTTNDDSWRVKECLEASRLLSWSPDVLGFTGGEPMLLGASLRHTLNHYRTTHPRTQLEVLTNGRLASDEGLARTLFDQLEATTWLVPLYGHAPFIHDFVVQAGGAFDETIAGLLNLQKYRQPIQLRIVLIKPVVQVLPQLCEFIVRNLPFVKEVALMGCEPIGFSLANQDECRIDIRDWHRELEQGIRQLQRGEIPVVLMNLPLCCLDKTLWPLAHRSISDWKNTYANECDTCVVKSDCCGLFEWYERGWKPSTLTPVAKLNRE